MQLPTFNGGRLAEALRAVQTFEQSVKRYTLTASVWATTVCSARTFPSTSSKTPLIFEARELKKSDVQRYGKLQTYFTGNPTTMRRHIERVKGHFETYENRCQKANINILPFYKYTMPQDVREQREAKGNGEAPP